MNRNPAGAGAFLRALRSVLLEPSGGALLHACALAIAGEAHLFIGPSRAGKSTLAGLAAASGRARVLGDEIIPLREEHGRFFVCGSPFWDGPLGRRPLKLPLAGIYTLRKAGNAALTPGPAAAIRPLLRSCCLNFGSDPRLAARLEKTLQRAARLYRGTLSFSKRDAACLRLLGARPPARLAGAGRPGAQKC